MKILVLFLAIVIVVVVVMVMASLTNTQSNDKANRKLRRAEEALELAREGVHRVASSETPQLERDLLEKEIQEALNPPHQRLKNSSINRRT